MKYISSPIEAIKSEYNIVVIGSGYGGAIAASRLSRAGQKVCLLERGKEHLPGEYPDNIIEATEQMQMHSAEGHVGNPAALFDFHVHENISVLVGCGLGGTSLINANVSIKPEDRVFEDTRWPEELRTEFKTPGSLLNKGYELAADMLKAKPLPEHIQLNKLTALEKSAKANGETFYRTDINVNFDYDGQNHVGVEQKPCNLCGNCCSGCNYGAKNTVLMNYLPDAVAHGAEIFTEAAVQYLEKKGDKWLVYFNTIDTGSNLFAAASSFVTADIVVLAAGTLGSSEIILRSKAKGLSVSDKAGCEFSGNGDVLGFGYNTRQTIDGVGSPARDHFFDSPAGPCITGIIDKRGQPVLEDGMIIEDAAIPGVLAPILPSAMALNDDLIGVSEIADDDNTLIDKLERKARIAESLLRGAFHGAIRNTQAYLLMTHDGEAGRFLLNDKNRLTIKWAGVGSEEIFLKADAALRKETKALSGTYVKNPVWIKEMNNELITVHPLGGCYMGSSIDTGVVNHKGQVFTNDNESGVFENLYITDGSVVPRSLGVNPLITISAISERCAALIAQDRGWKIDYSFAAPGMPEPGHDRTVGVEFTETMKGFFTKAAADYASGFDQGKERGESLSFTLTIRSDDVYTMISDTSHQAKMTGTVTAPGLSPLPMNVSGGVFNLFVDDPENLDTKLMKYAMLLNAEDGKQYYFKGFKFVHHDKGLDEWSDTSTLYITLFDGADENAPVIGKGILHILLADFAKQMTTMKAVNATSTEDGLKALAAFGAYFARSLFQVYGGIFAPDKYFDADAKPRKKRPLKMCDPEFYPFKTEDGVDVLLTRYNGGGKTPVMMMHPFNGNRYIYSLDTIDTNLAEYVYAAGYDVWLLDNRLSNLLPSSKGEYNCDQLAQFGIPAAVKKVLEVSGANELDLVGHCVGSITAFMAVLYGLKGVRSIVALQIASNFVPAPQVKWKSGLHLPELLAAMGIESLTAYACMEEGEQAKLFDLFNAEYAERVAGVCNSPVCQRMSFMFGPLFEHNNLNVATHDALVEMLGVANIKTYEHLTLMIRSGHLVSATGEDIYMPNIERLAIPITFFHGDKNCIFDPESTKITFDKLCEANGAQLYRRHILPGYGHSDCLIGKNAVVDVFPLILEHLEQFKN